jgi:(p)ppGpp synthase/HD superfamily hydrolase
MNRFTLMYAEESSRVHHLETTLNDLDCKMALKALDLVRNVMRKEEGYNRHDGSHYYFHLVDVTQILLNFNIKDENIITASLLHDIVEDCAEKGYTLEFVRQEFNEEVAIMVDLVSKKPDLDYKKADVLNAYLEAIFEHYGAALIKTADRIHNFSSLRDATPEKKLKQAIETETFFIPFFKRCRKKYVRFASFFFFAKTHIEPSLFEIKECHAQVSVLKERIGSLTERISTLEKIYFEKTSS